MVFIGTHSPYVTGNWQKVFPNIEPASLEKECWSDIAKRETGRMKARDRRMKRDRNTRDERARKRERESGRSVTFNPSYFSIEKSAKTKDS